MPGAKNPNSNTQIAAELHYKKYFVISHKTKKRISNQLQIPLIKKRTRLLIFSACRVIFGIKQRKMRRGHQK